MTEKQKWCKLRAEELNVAIGVSLVSGYAIAETE